MGTSEVLFVVDCVVDGDVTGNDITRNCITGTGNREPEMKGR